MKEYKELTIDYGKGVVKKLTPHKHFSGEYVDERNKLIPIASPTIRINRVMRINRTMRVNK